MKAPAGQGGRASGLNNATVPLASASRKRIAAVHRAPDGAPRVGVASAAGDSQVPLARATATKARRPAPEERL
jgi:hypothetical protein